MLSLDIPANTVRPHLDSISEALREATAHLNVEELQRECSGEFYDGYTWNWRPDVGMISVQAPDSEHTFKDSAYETIGSFIVQTITNFVSRTTRAAVDVISKDRINFEFDVEGYEPAIIELATKDCMSMIENPTGEKAIDLLEFITETIGITADEIKLSS